MFAFPMENKMRWTLSSHPLLVTILRRSLLHNDPQIFLSFSFWFSCTRQIKMSKFTVWAIYSLHWFHLQSSFIALLSFTRYVANAGRFLLCSFWNGPPVQNRELLFLLKTPPGIKWKFPTVRCWFRETKKTTQTAVSTHVPLFYSPLAHPILWSICTKGQQTTRQTMHRMCWTTLGKKRTCLSTNKTADLTKFCHNYQHLEEWKEEHSFEKHMLHNLEEYFTEMFDILKVCRKI